jgi:hypothetical protein
MIIIVFILISAVSISMLWAKGITYMKENHPEYKGEDFLDW